MISAKDGSHLYLSKEKIGRIQTHLIEFIEIFETLVDLKKPVVLTPGELRYFLLLAEFMYQQCLPDE